MMASALSKKSSCSALGAPSQHNQSSRKGKKAWRKNVDIGDVEQGLEGLRQEERVTGTILQKIKDSDLFTVDLIGDEQIRKSTPRYSAAQLTSSKILAQRSAVPAVFSRTTSTTITGKRKSVLTREEKDKLMRIAKRPRKGPFNSIMDPSEYAAGSGTVALSAAVKNSGTYDPWVPQLVEEVKDGLETVQEKKFKPPVLTKQRDLIDVPAIVEPHQGTSYNPPVDAHQELLSKAAAIEEKRLKDAERLAAVKAKMDNALQESDGLDNSAAAGMAVTSQVDDEDEDEEAVEEEGDGQKSIKLPERKTKAQKNKATRVLAEKRALIQRAERKRLLASISGAKQLRKSNTELKSIRDQQKEERRLALAEKLRKQGLAGQKLGRHKVPESELAVQLGEDLSESLRGLKPEGNLFRDRFQSLQQRALIEPRVLVLPKKRRHKMVEYEKHAWKRFE
ncbi:P60-like protein [Phlegmacium glaucopus]|nr:P60-like protein [Phlegmacium glaucopus]